MEVDSGVGGEPKLQCTTLARMEYEMELAKLNDEADAMGAIFPNWRLTSPTVSIEDGVLPSLGHCLPWLYIKNPGLDWLRTSNAGPVKFANIETRQTFLVSGLDGAELLYSKGGWLLLRSDPPNELPAVSRGWIVNKGWRRRDLPQVVSRCEKKNPLPVVSRRKNKNPLPVVSRRRKRVRSPPPPPFVPWERNKEGNGYFLLNATSGARLDLPTMLKTRRPGVAFTLTSDGVPDLVLYAHVHKGRQLTVCMARPGESDWVVHTTLCVSDSGFVEGLVILERKAYVFLQKNFYVLDLDGFRWQEWSQAFGSRSTTCESFSILECDGKIVMVRSALGNCGPGPFYRMEITGEDKLELVEMGEDELEGRVWFLNTSCQSFCVKVKGRGQKVCCFMRRDLFRSFGRISGSALTVHCYDLVRGTCARLTSDSVVPYVRGNWVDLCTCGDPNHADLGVTDDDLFPGFEEAAYIGEEHDIDFVISTGDNFYKNGLTGVDDKNFEQSFSDIYTAESLQKPWYTVLGNHDYRGDVIAQLSPALKKLDSRFICMRSFIVNAEIVDFFFVDTTPFVTKYWTTPKDHHYDWRDVAPRKTYMSNLLKDLDNALKASSAKWKIVVGHHTMRSVSIHGDTVELLQYLLPVIKENGVDFYVNGHDHCLEHISSIDSSLQYFTSGGGSKAWRGSYNSNPDKLHFFYDGQGFMSLKLTESEADIAFYDVTGSPLYKWSMTKNMNLAM